MCLGFVLNSISQLMPIAKFVSRHVSRIIFTFALLFVVAWARPALAYPWMIRHDYTGCVTCHADPSGGGLLTAYGRGQSDILLRSHYKGGTPEEPAKSSGYLWGLATPPDWLLLGGSFRGLEMYLKPDGQKATTSRPVIMQADLRGQIQLGGFRANASFGYVSSSASAASVTGNLVSREHWLGYAFDDDAILIRAGRMNLPFGLRMIEHTMFVRHATRTDINDNQQHGIAFAYSGDLIRAEVMGILGNYQVGPDVYRERGYSGYIEIVPAQRVAVGVSSLVTHAARDLYLFVANTRQAHGAFARVSPWRPLVLMAEADLVVQAPSGVNTLVGYASMLQADVEPWQGLHFIGTTESFKQQAGFGQSWAGWLGTGWFFAPHTDLRVDFMRRSDAVGNGRSNSTALLGQIHVFL